ncbi:MAG: hypothetical protein A2W26_02480 [Acidobacteria bacterium RBG_16_64_8]|nr:MAG: hypothetical protein A2W26_02480 [Acidobacteria bacterium RBG_16_64_8]
MRWFWAVMLLGAGAVILSACGRRPTYVTRYGAEVYDDYGVFNLAFANAMEDAVMDNMVRLGFDRPTMEKCIADTYVDVVEKVTGADLEACGKGCSAFTRGNHIVFDKTRNNPCMYVYAHELQHRFLLCHGLDGDGGHTNPDLWGKGAMIEVYWNDICRGMQP